MEIIKKKISDTELLLKPMGRIDVNVAYKFEHDVSKELEGIKIFTLDFSNVEYISSIGLRVLLEFQKKMEAQGNMKIINVRPEILEIFSIVRFDKILNIV